MLRYITQKTLIPIGVAICVFGGASAWLTTLHVNTLANSRTLSVIINKQDRFQDDLSAIRQDVAVIKATVGHTKQ